MKDSGRLHDLTWSIAALSVSFQLSAQSCFVLWMSSTFIVLLLEESQESTVKPRKPGFPYMYELDLKTTRKAYFQQLIENRLLFMVNNTT